MFFSLFLSRDILHTPGEPTDSEEKISSPDSFFGRDLQHMGEPSGFEGEIGSLVCLLVVIYSIFDEVADADSKICSLVRFLFVIYKTSGLLLSLSQTTTNKKKTL